MENKILIDSVNNLKVALNEISVYDFDVYTSMELYYKIAENFNKVIRELSRFEGLISEEIVKQNEKLIYLLGEGLNQEVVNKINNMVETGVFDSIINLNIFNNLKEDIKNVSSQLEHIADYNSYPQGVKPSKSGSQKNSFKIIKKTKDNELIIVQPTNKGCIKYTFQRGVGASQEGRDYGINHELLRIVKAEHIQDTYVYYDISTPIDGSFTSPPLHEPSKINTVEQLVCYTSDYDEVNTFSSKTNGLGIGAYKLYYGTSVSYNIPVTMNGKCNLLFLGSSTSPQKIEIYVNDILVKEFNPRVFVMESYNGIGLIEFDVPTKSTTNSVFKVTIKNADSIGYFYPCAINFKKLEQYNGEHITDFKCFGSTSSGWITSNGASDYALYDADNKLWFGSYHGGEILELEQISWGTQTVEENPYYINNTTLSDINLNDWRIQKTFKIYQQTNLANNKAKMVSIFNFDNDGTLDMDFNYYDGQVNLSTFYTALTCTNVNFNYVFYPIFKNLGTTPTNTDIALPATEGKVSQVNSSDKLQLDIRFTKFNNSRYNRGCVIADNDAYRKLYYGPIHGKSYLLENLTFSKSLDFIVR